MADLHSLTVPTEPADIMRRTRITAAQYIAGGVDPLTSAVFCQSHVQEHAELAWVLACQTAVGEMNRMTQFKDKTAKGGNANVGLFTYPVLMAGDSQQAATYGHLDSPANNSASRSRHVVASLCRVNSSRSNRRTSRERLIHQQS